MKSIHRRFRELYSFNNRQLQKHPEKVVDDKCAGYNGVEARVSLPYVIAGMFLGVYWEFNEESSIRVE